MELFAPEHLPGVGMGDLGSIVAICGLLGLAATSGALVAEGALGTLVFALAALAVLGQKEDFGGSVPAAAAVLVFLLLAAATRWLLAARARRDAAALVGAAADAPETRAVRTTITRRERWAQRLAVASVAWAGAATGLAWAEWNEAPFRLADAEAGIGLAVGIVAAAIAGDAAWRFLQGALRAGGSPVVVGAVVVAVALALNVASVYVPFAGLVVLVLAGILAVRLRRRQQQKYGGLRILN